MSEQNLPADVLLLDVPEAARRLGLSRSKTYTYIQSGQLRSVTFGRRRKIPLDALPEFIKSQEESNTSGSGW